MSLNYLTQVRNHISNYYSMTDSRQKEELLRNMKIIMLNFVSLPPTNQPFNKEEFTLSREIIECEMDFYLKQNNEKNFERGYLKAKQFYFDYKNLLDKAHKMLYYSGLYLLHLLANNRNTEYNTELELFTMIDQKDKYIRIAINLEQGIMEGSYKQIMNVENSADVHYRYYLQKFEGAIRFQIARSAEKSYDTLKLSDAVSLLKFNNASELTNYIKSEVDTIEDREIDWKVIGERLNFIPRNKDKIIIPSSQIIDDTVLLAIELEKII